MGLKGGISIDADSGPPRYVLWCCGGICHQLLTFFQIGRGHTVDMEGEGVGVQSPKSPKLCLRNIWMVPNNTVGMEYMTTWSGGYFTFWYKRFQASCTCNIHNWNLQSIFTFHFFSCYQMMLSNMILEDDCLVRISNDCGTMNPLGNYWWIL